MAFEKLEAAFLSPMRIQTGRNIGAMNPNPNEQRTLKVELAGDMYYRKTFPKIRLQGKWLADVGFKPTGRVAIVARCSGELLLKFIEPV
jgi:hypothetical protein